MKVLCKEKVFVVNVLGSLFPSTLSPFLLLTYPSSLIIDNTHLSCTGYVAYNFVIGAYSYWGPKAGYNIYKMVEE